jgi:hypothetical protein
VCQTNSLEHSGPSRRLIQRRPAPAPRSLVQSRAPPPPGPPDQLSQHERRTGCALDRPDLMGATGHDPRSDRLLHQASGDGGPGRCRQLEGTSRQRHIPDGQLRVGHPRYRRQLPCQAATKTTGSIVEDGRLRSEPLSLPAPTLVRAQAGTTRSITVTIRPPRCSAGLLGSLLCSVRHAGSPPDGQRFYECSGGGRRIAVRLRRRRRLLRSGCGSAGTPPRW